MNYYLSLILFTPLVGALVILLINKQNVSAIRWIANAFAMIGFLISVPLWYWYNPDGAQYQFIERAPWIPSIGADYFLGLRRRIAEHRAEQAPAPIAAGTKPR